jgi:hypothetical protein
MREDVGVGQVDAPVTLSKRPAGGRDARIEEVAASSAEKPGRRSHRLPPAPKHERSQLTHLWGARLQTTLTIGLTVRAAWKQSHSAKGVWVG